MISRYYWSAIVMAALTSRTLAERATIIPADLQGGFVPDGDEVQVSFTNEAINGFTDGTVFTKQAVAKEPTFALGDSNGITPSTLYTIIMVDTTCLDARRLHYARANFKNNFDITNINTSFPPIVDYVAPGTVGEKGNRQYIFLMYENPGTENITRLKLQGDNTVFNVQRFQGENGLNDAVAGVGMVVKLGGEADCGNKGAQQAPDNRPKPKPEGGRPRPGNGRPGRAGADGAEDAAEPPMVPPPPPLNGTDAKMNNTYVPPTPPTPPTPMGHLAGTPDPANDDPIIVPVVPASSAVESSPAKPARPSATTVLSLLSENSAGSLASTSDLGEQKKNTAIGNFQRQNWMFTLMLMTLCVLFL